MKMKDQATALEKAAEKKAEKAPLFVEAETMLEKMSALTRETSQKAFEFFMEHGGSFGSRFDDWLHAEMELLRPVPVEITEDENVVNIRAAVPGFKPDEIELSVKDNELFLSGETETTTRNENEKVFYSEWRSNRFYRQLQLPADVEPAADANLKDGVLAITLKKKPVGNATPIAVKAA